LASPLAGTNQENTKLDFTETFLVATSFGLLTGLVEGTALVIFQSLHWLGWTISLAPINSQILWISPIFDLLMFASVGLILTLTGRFFSPVSTLEFKSFAFSFLAFLDWLVLTGHIRHLGAFALAVGLAAALTRWVRRNKETTLRLARRIAPGAALVVLILLIGVRGGSWFAETVATRKLSPAPGLPNILIIVVDTLRADHVHNYGYSRETTPNMDRIAQQGIVFENAFSTSSWTLPSHASLFTGYYPHDHGAEYDVYDGRYPTLAQALQSRGYRTGAFSANLDNVSRASGFGFGFIHFEDFFTSVTDMAARTIYGRLFELFVLRPLGFEDIPGRKRAIDVTRSTLRWIGQDRGKPFFAFLNYFDVHEPFLPPQPYRSRFAKGSNPGGILNARVMREHPRMTPEQLQGEIDAYDGAITYVDDSIAKLFAGLEELGMAEGTLVIITSDHGESLGDHALFLHRNALYRELIHVPLVCWWPGHLPAGLRVAQPVSNAAIPATLMEILGSGSDQSTFPGPSLVQLWKSPGARPDWPDPLAELAQMQFPGVEFNPNYSGSMKSLISAQWQYIVHQKSGEKLYNWQTDPKELSDLTHTPQGESIVRDFAGRLQKQLGSPQKATVNAHVER